MGVQKISQKGILDFAICAEHPADVLVLAYPPRSRVDERCRANRTRAPRATSPRVHTGAAMKPGAFIAKWRVSELKESSAAQEHFSDLCRMLASRHRRRPT